MRCAAVVARLREQLLQSTVERDLDVARGLSGALADEPVPRPGGRGRLGAAETDVTEEWSVR